MHVRLPDRWSGMRISAAFNAATGEVVTPLSASSDGVIKVVDASANADAPALPFGALLEAGGLQGGRCGFIAQRRDD